MAIYLNQVGYNNQAKKVATATKAGKFQVVNAQTKQVVWEKECKTGVFDAAAGEETFAVDFSEVTTEGRYYITDGAGEVSHTFAVGAVYEVTQGFNQSSLFPALRLRIKGRARRCLYAWCVSYRKVDSFRGLYKRYRASAGI